MATYGDVWKECEETFGTGTRFDVDVSGARMRNGEVRIEWTISHYRGDRASASSTLDLEQIEGATAEEVITQLRALGQTSKPGDVGEVGAGK